MEVPCFFSGQRGRECFEEAKQSIFIAKVDTFGVFFQAFFKQKIGKVRGFLLDGKIVKWDKWVKECTLFGDSSEVFFGSKLAVQQDYRLFCSEGNVEKKNIVLSDFNRFCEITDDFNQWNP